MRAFLSLATAIGHPTASEAPAVTDSDRLARSFDALRVRLHYVNRAWTVDKYAALLAFFVRIVPPLMNAERFGVFIVEQERKRVISTAGTGLEDGEIEGSGFYRLRFVRDRVLVIGAHLRLGGAPSGQTLLRDSLFLALIPVLSPTAATSFTTSATAFA